MEKGIKLLNPGYSISIKNDYRNNEKMNSYIPTFKSLKMLDKIISSILKQENGSFLLSGAYGTGKSFFTSLLLNLLSAPNLEELKEFVSKSEVKYPLTEVLNKISKKPHLIVFADDTEKEFDKAIILGIYSAIDQNKLKIRLNNEFAVIYEKIMLWKETNEEIYIKFLNKLNEKKIEKDLFFELLRKNEEKVLEIFHEIYSDIFYGEKFFIVGALKSLDSILENFEAEILKNGDYEGIIYVFDEFGRYLENNIETVDVLQVQKIAEYCSLKNKSNFILITHKGIFQYTNKLTRKDNIFEWEKVSGRFQREQLVYEKTTSLDIISESLYKNAEYEVYKKENKKKFELYEANLKCTGLTGSEYGNVCDKYYPLNYIAAYILPDLSQKIAQNERTLFSFISSKEEKSLRNIMKEDFLVGLDRVYNYFEDNFRFLNLDSLEYKNYLNSKILLTKTIDELEIKLIKSLAVIYIYNKFSDINPTKENLMLALNIDEETFKKLSETLQEKNLISYKRHFNHYKMVEDTDVNIEKEVRSYTEEKIKNINYNEILNRVLKQPAFYPLSYNEENDINRFLGKYYLDISNLSELDIIKKNVDDGKIIYLLNLEDNKNESQILEMLREDDLILVKNKNSSRLDIKYFLREINAIENLFLEEKYSEGILKNELTLFYKEIIVSLKEILDNHFSSKNSVILIKDKNFNHEAGMLKITNAYLKNKYEKFIPLNYEIINKNIITVPIRKVRVSILNKIISKKYDEFSEEYFTKTGAENSVGRIILKNNEFFKDGELNFENKYKEIEHEIVKKIISSSYEVKEIYDCYCSSNSKYGFRKGFFTLLLGMILIKNQSIVEIVCLEGNLEQELTGELIEELEKNPEKYKINYFELSRDKKIYLEKLEKALKEYYVEKSRRKTENIMNSFKNYFYSLPRIVNSIYLKETSLLSKIMVGIFGDKNPTEFIIKEIPKRVKNEDFEDIVKMLNADFDIIKNSLKTLENAIEEIVISLFGNSEKNLEKSFENWKKETKETENSFQLWLKNYKFINKKQFIKDITQKVKGFDFENWIELSDISDFNEKLNTMFKTTNKNNTKKIEFIEIKTNDSNTKIDFSEEVSVMGKVLKKKLETDIKNMGITISDDEKKKILVEILMSL